MKKRHPTRNGGRMMGVHDDAAPSAAGGASIEVIEGRLRSHAGGQPWGFGTGERIALADNLREPITAREETAFLLAAAWPAGAGAWEQEMASGYVQRVGGLPS